MPDIKVIDRDEAVEKIRQQVARWEKVYQEAFASQTADDVDTCRRATTKIQAFELAMELINQVPAIDHWVDDPEWDGTQEWVGEPIDHNPYHFVGMFTAWTPNGDMLFKAKLLDKEGREPHFHVGDTLTITHTLTAS